MLIQVFSRGLLIGLCIAAPVGPIGVLCIRRSLSQGSWFGFATGLGAAIADAMYGAVAAFGLTAVSGFLIGVGFWLGLFGGVFLCYLGARTWRAPVTDRGPLRSEGTLLTACLSTLILTLTNPMTILSFIAIYAGFGVAGPLNYWAAGVLVLGVFAGSAAWWLALSGAVGIFRSRMSVGWMRRINLVSGGIIIAFGVYALARALQIIPF